MFCIPEAFERYRVPDDFPDACYESTPAPQRAWIKTTLALMQCLYGEHPSREERTLLHAERGFGATFRQVPAPWVLLVLDGTFASAPRAAAVLTAARLAGTAHPVAVWSVAPPPPVAAALVLTGVEQLLCLPEDRMPDLLDELARTQGRGRLVLFSAAHEALLRRAETAGIPYRRESRPPRLGILPPADPDPEVLRRAHPDAEILVCDPSGPPPAHLDALYASSPDTGDVRADLVLTPGLEGCWIYPDLRPDFFLNREAVLAVAPRSDADLFGD